MSNSKDIKEKQEGTQVKEKKISTVTVILIVQLVVMAALILIMTISVGRLTRENALNHMATITDERAQIIQNYVVNSEKTLRSFSKASQVKDLLELSKKMDLHELVDEENHGYAPDAYEKYPEEMKILEAAQAYTVDFGNDVDNLEGFWIGSWETLVMTQTNPAVVGMTTRTDPERLKQLQDGMLNGNDGLYNAGIIISPATNKQILSMYIEVKDDNGDPIGLVGLGIFTDQLVNNLDSMAIRGIDDFSYSMVNSADNKYIFNSDKSLVTQEATNSDVRSFAAARPSQPGSFEYKGADGKDYVSTYTYIRDYGWLMMLDAPKSEVYEMTSRMIVFVVIFGILILGLILVFSFLNKRQEAANRKLSKQIQKTEKTKESLSTAMFMDILTNVSNRVSFSMDLEKITPSKDHPYYFSMFNILDFSSINTAYGNDAGDAILVNTADILRESFPDGTVYRTGSDEFVVAVSAADNSQTSYQQMLRQTKDAQGKLMGPQSTPGGVVTATYKITMVKKSDELNSSVITILKDIANKQPSKTLFGQIQLIDLDM